jgi:hypothetical protein
MMTDEAQPGDCVPVKVVSFNRRMGEDTDQEGSQGMEKKRLAGEEGGSDEVLRHSRRSPSASRISMLKQRSVRNVHILKEQTIETYQHSLWCFFPRWVSRFPHNWPRVTSFVVGIVLPLWILIGLASGFGVLLAGYENGPEIES